MLDVTMTTDFVPGTNLKGGVAGGNWTFLLPSLELDQVVSLGAPSVATLATLSRCAERVLVVCRNRRQLQKTSQLVRQRGLSNVRPLLHGDGQAAEITAGSTDLVILANCFERFRLALSSPARAQASRWLHPQGRLYLELSGLAYRFLAPLPRGPRAGRFGDAQVLWLTPLLGQSHTFTPLGDKRTAEFFWRAGLTSTSLRSDTWKQLRSFGRKSPGVSPEPSRPGEQAGSRKARRTSQFAWTAQLLARTAKQVVQQVSNCCERFFLRPAGLGTWFGRRGVFLGRNARGQGLELPRYLLELALRSGVSIGSCRWGLSASGDYESRKIVFFLFQEEDTPQYVIKMTRSASLNGRLNQECRALQLLEEKEIGDRETLPRVVFSGTHGGLAIVGETAIVGVPFDRRTTATAACPYARAAIDWLTELGAATAAPFAAQPGEVAATLQRLLARFAEVYDITEGMRAFLQAQISVIEFNRMPLVFQHGDPGRWNVLVTPKGRISFLDWEAAEPDGMPLWDLLYFIRSFCMCVAQAQRFGDRLRTLDEVFLQDSPVAELAVESISNYCVETGLASHLVEPLFYTCWMHRALKESTRLPTRELHTGHYFNFLRQCIEKRDAPTLKHLFSLS